MESVSSENVGVPERAEWLRLSQRQPTILEGESSETSGQGRDERHWLPGCLRPPPLLFYGTGKGRWRSQRLRMRGRVTERIGNRLRQMRHSSLSRGVSAVGPKRSFRRPAVTKADQETTNDAVEVAGLGRICFGGLLFGSGLGSSLRNALPSKSSAFEIPTFDELRASYLGHRTC